MKFATVTKIIIIVLAIALTIYDLIVFFTPEKNDTISQILLGWAKKEPIIPFAFGVLMGHLFWPNRIEE